MRGFSLYLYHYHYLTFLLSAPVYRIRCFNGFASTQVPVPPNPTMTQTPGQEPPVQESPKKPRTRRAPAMARFVAISWRDLAISFGPILLISAAAIYLAVRLIQPAPPSTLTMSAGTKAVRSGT